MKALAHNLAKAAILALAVLMLGGCSIASLQSNAAPALLPPVKEKVDLYEVRTGNIEVRYQWIGTFVPKEITYYEFTSGGRIGAYHVQQGDRVKKGDLLVELNTGNLPLQLIQRKLDVEKAIEEVEKARATQDESVIRLRQMEYELEMMRLREVERNLRNTRLYSDTDGVVVFIDEHKPGQQITAYRPMIGITDPGRVVLQYVGEGGYEFVGVTPGMAAIVEFGGREYAGRITQTPNSVPYNNDRRLAELNNKSILIEVEGLPTEAAIGHKAEITVVTQRRENVLIIPRVGLRTYQGRDYVQIMDGETRREVDVQRGIVSATEVEIRAGLRSGQHIILNN